MSVLHLDTAAVAALGSAQSRGVWQGLTHALDRLVTARSKRAVPEAQLRRSKHDIDRCRRLMLHDCVAADRLSRP